MIGWLHKAKLVVVIPRNEGSVATIIVKMQSIKLNNKDKQAAPPYLLMSLLTNELAIPKSYPQVFKQTKV
jgi:hypothetical protein